MKNATVIAHREGRKFWIVGDHITFKLGPEHSRGGYAVAESWVADGGGPPPHVHHREDELFYLLEGEHEFLLHDKTFRGGAGTAVYLPKDIIHTFRCVGGRPSRKLVIAAPCGFETFVERAGEPFDCIPHPKQVGPADIEKLLAIAPEFGLEVFPEHQPTGPAPARPPDRRIWVLGQLITIKLASADTNGRFTVADIDLRPGGSVPQHSHREMDEIFWVLEGNVEFILDGKRVPTRKDTLVHVPAGVLHSFRSTNGARLADFHTPGGFERFFEEAGVSCSDPDAAPPPFDIEKVLPLFSKHGMDIPPS